MKSVEKKLILKKFNDSMVFSSALFLCLFLPIFLLIYELTPKNLKNTWILLASLVFFSWGAPKFVFVLVFVTIFDFFLVRKLHESHQPHVKKFWLVLSLCMNVGMLAYFKYANFFVDNVNSILQHIGIQPIQWLKVALPIGISFFTFQSLTYAVDVYRGVHQPLKRVRDYLLFITIFPQMIAGPIVRYNAIADQIEERKETYDDKLFGLIRFCIGLGKKVFIANTLGKHADFVFENGFMQLTTPEAWIGIAAYTLQIYFDFSGYSDMAIGLGRMMGFTFPENFDSPYTSHSITEFWRRWHITLGSWMRDYLYIPLGGNRVSKQRLYFNLWFVFVISGLWHGASWNFVIWGAYHGLFLILERLFLLRWLQKIPSWIQIIYTLLTVMIGWVFFRLEHLNDALHYIQRLFSFSSFSITQHYTPEMISMFIAGIFFALLTLTSPGKKWEQHFYHPLSVMKMSWLGIYLPVAILFFIVALSSIIAQGFNPFIYFRF